MKRNTLTLALMFTIALTISARAMGVTGGPGGPEDKKKNSIANVFGQPAKTNSKFISTEDFHAFVKSMKSEKLDIESDNLATFNWKYDDVTFPTVMNKNDDGTIVWTTLRLAVIPEELDPGTYTHRLLELMDRSGMYGDFFFGYHSKSRTITLCGAFQLQRQFDDAKLRENMDKMARIAVETWDMWDPSSWNDVPQHVGNWACGESEMKLELTASGHFRLNTSSTSTQGAYEIDGDQLVMKDETGVEMVATVSFENANNFVLGINGRKFGFARD